MRSKGVGGIWLALAALSVAGAGAARGESVLRVSGGTLRVEGTIRADTVRIEAGARLTGGGTVAATSVVAGVVSPGASSGTDVGTLTFAKALTFLPGSQFECQAASHTQLDLIVCSAAVSGAGTVVFSKAPAAIPLRQTMIDGAASSDYQAFEKGGTSPDQWQLEGNGAGDLLLTDLVGDSDGDALPDWWEMQYFLGRTNATAGADGDGDRMNNEQEYRAGTDPASAGSCLTAWVGLTQTRPIEIRWASASNRLYALERSATLETGSFAAVAIHVPATPPINRYEDVTATNLNRGYYRIRVE
jgi:hypothetical protein